MESAEVRDLYPVKSNRELLAHPGERIWYRVYNVKLSIMSPFNRGRLSLAQTWPKRTWVTYPQTGSMPSWDYDHIPSRLPIPSRSRDGEGRPVNPVSLGFILSLTHPFSCLSAMSYQLLALKRSAPQVQPCWTLLLLLAISHELITACLAGWTT